MFYGNLDASQAIAGIAFTLGLGLSELRCEVAVPLILNLHGNAIPLSNELNPTEIVWVSHGIPSRSSLAQVGARPHPRIFPMAILRRFSSWRASS